MQFSLRKSRIKITSLTLRSRKKENIRFEKDNSTRKLSKKFDRLAKYIYYIEISLNTSFLNN